MHILIIEDEYSLADAIAETLKKENFTTNIITDGEEGENEALTIELPGEETSTEWCEKVTDEEYNKLK